MKLLLDTQTFLWSVSAPRRLSADARSAIEDGTNEVFVSVASAWEIAIKVGLGRLSLPQDTREFVPAEIERHAFQTLPVHLRHALEVTALARLHRDPFDRLLVAQAQVEALVVVTSDPQIRKYPIETIW